VEVMPPDINQSEREFSILYPEDDLSKGKILFGLGAIKGVGAAALSPIFEARADEPFVDIYDFTSRVDLGKVNKAVVESLIKAGAFDLLDAHRDLNRGQVFSVLDRALERGRSAQRDRESGQISLFGALNSTDVGDSPNLLPSETNFDDTQPWDELTLLAHEKQAIGFYMSGHPMERFSKEAERLANCNSQTSQNQKRGAKVTLAGMVMDLREKTTKSGKRMALFSLEDLAGRVEIVVYSEALVTWGEVLKSEEPLVISGTIRTDQRNDEEQKNIILEQAIPLQQARAKRTKEVHLHLDAIDFTPMALGDLKIVLERHPGRCDTYLVIGIPRRSVTTVSLPEQFRVAPSDDLLRELDNFAGVKQIEFR
jgi:DNA polymerase-3 subunit alpha